MSSGFYGPEGFGSSPFDEFLARLYGGGSGQPRPVHRVDIMRLMSGPARELLGAAAAHATEQGDADLGTKHLLWAAADLEPTRQLLARAGADPAALARAADGQERGAPGGTGEHSVNRAAAGGGPSQLTPPQLTPGAKRALLDAHQISRSLGSTYIGAEHILFALAVNPESGAGRILSAARVTPDVLRGALLAQGVPPAQGAPPAGRPRPRLMSSAVT
jgi:ATP-dependent Clp protease ATP-binding subunit ClpC